MIGCWPFYRSPENGPEEWVGQMTRKRRDNIKMELIFLYHDDVRRNYNLESCNITSWRWFHQIKCLLYLATVTDSAASQACYLSSFTGWAPWCGRRNWNHQSVLQQRCISVSLIFVCLSVYVLPPAIRRLGVSLTSKTFWVSTAKLKTRKTDIKNQCWAFWNSDGTSDSPLVCLFFFFAQITLQFHL